MSWAEVGKFLKEASALAPAVFAGALLWVEIQRDRREADNALKLHIRNRFRQVLARDLNMTVEAEYMVKYVAPGKERLIVEAYEEVYEEACRTALFGITAVPSPEKFIASMEELQAGRWDKLPRRPRLAWLPVLQRKRATT